MEILQRASLLGSYVAAPPSTSARSLSSPSVKVAGSSTQVCFPRSGRIARLVVIRAGRRDRNGNEEADGEDEATNQEIPATSGEFLKRVSSRAYDTRRKLEHALESNSYDVLESNPWREDSKAVYVLAQKENQLLTMRTRRERSEVSKELSMLLPKRGNRRGRSGNVSPPGSDSPFRMQVEDIREGVLVFEDEDEAARYCSLLDGICRGIAEIEASDVFALCKNNKTLAVLFRRGTVPPQPDRLQKNLNARNHSLED